MFVAVDHFPMLHPRFDADSVPGIATALDSSWDQHRSCLIFDGKLVLGIAFQMVIPKSPILWVVYTIPNGRFIIGFPTLYRIH